MEIRLGMQIVSFFVTCCLALNMFASTASANLTEEDLTMRINDLGGNDARLFRYDATRRTRYKQRYACESLPVVLKGIINPGETESWKWLAAEYAAFCITDNPYHRGLFASFGEPLYEAVVQLVQSTDPHVSAKASHLVYIGTFSNPENHQGFVGAGAISALSNVLKNNPAPLQFMWSAVALANIGASYCLDEEGEVGRCDWEWGQEDRLKAEAIVASDGSASRLEMLKDPRLIQVLADQVCKGPIMGPPSDTNPLPSETARAGEHDDHENIKTFAAAGALRNMAIAKEARGVLEPFLPCFCKLKHSSDPFEKSNGHDCVVRQRLSDACWMEGHRLKCVDRYFQDGHGNGCDIIDPHDVDDECPDAVDKHGVAARDACCICGGGDRQDQQTVHEEL